MRIHLRLWVILGTVAALSTGVCTQDPPRTSVPLFETAATDSARPAPSIQAGRSPEMRLRFARRAEHRGRAVDAGLAWLASQQQDDGSFEGDGFDDDRGRVATTAAALLAFLGAGSTPERGTHRGVVRDGLSWLAGRQDDAGWIGEASAAEPSGASVRAHALATYVFVDAAYERRFPRVSEHAVRALHALQRVDATDPWRTAALAYGVRAGLFERHRRTRAAGEDHAPQAYAGSIVAAFLRAGDGPAPDIPERLRATTAELVTHADSAVALLAVQGLHQLGGHPWRHCERTLRDWTRDQRPDGAWAVADAGDGAVFLTAMRVASLEQQIFFIRMAR